MNRSASVLVHQAASPLRLRVRLTYRRLCLDSRGEHVIELLLMLSLIGLPQQRLLTTLVPGSQAKNSSLARADAARRQARPAGSGQTPLDSACVDRCPVPSVGSSSRSRSCGPARRQDFGCQSGGLRRGGSRLILPAPGLSPVHPRGRAATMPHVIALGSVCDVRASSIVMRDGGNRSRVAKSAGKGSVIPDSDH